MSDRTAVPTPSAVSTSSSSAFCTPAIDDVHRAHALANGTQGGDQARLHLASDDVVAQQCVRFARGQNIGERPVAVIHAGDVGHQDEFFGLQCTCEPPGKKVGVDVIGSAVQCDTDGHHHGNELAREEEFDERGIDALDVADEAQVGRIRAVRRKFHRAGADEATILTVEPDRTSTMFIDELRQFLIELAQRHCHDGQRARVSDAQAAIAPVLEPHLAHQLVDVPPATVHNDRLHADEAKKRDVAREARLEGRIGHRTAAKANHYCLAVERSDVRERFGQDTGFLIWGHSVLGGARQTEC